MICRGEPLLKDALKLETEKHLHTEHLHAQLIERDVDRQSFLQARTR
jgi:hypothetical protein